MGSLVRLNALAEVIKKYEEILTNKGGLFTVRQCVFISLFWKMTVMLAGISCLSFQESRYLLSMNTEVDSENNKSATWSETKAKKRKQNMMDVDNEKDKRPHFPPVKKALLSGSDEIRKIPVPPNRYTPLKENWMKIFTPVVQYLNLNIRFNLRTRMVEIRTCEETKDIASLQKAADFVRAFTLGFEVEDALSLIRLDELFLESFDVKDVKTLHGDHLSRAIGRLVGKNGKTKYTIENATKTRIVVADSKIHILGSYQNIRAARTTLCSLILGSAPSKVYGTMRTLSSRLSESI